jgi:hypothetical protein
MSWQDFQLHFRSLYICQIYPQEMCSSIHGEWQGPTIGGCQNFDTWHLSPQFHFKAIGPHACVLVHVFITLTQVFLFSFFHVISFVGLVSNVFHDYIQSHWVLLKSVGHIGIGVHVFSWCRAIFGNYQFVGESSFLFYWNAHY